MNVCVIGLWHQGIVGAACLADLGGSVVAADHDASKVALLNGGKAPLFEPGLDELIGKGLAVGRLRFSTEVAGSVQGCPYVLIMFDTPVNDRDESDLSEVFSAAAEIAPHLEDGVVLYVTAQVPVGSCDRIAQIVREGNPSLRFGIAYSPENLRLGQAIDRFLHPPLPVIGADDPATLDRLEPLLAPLGVKWVKVGLRTAEMTKHALNAFLATSICFANELGNLCDEVGADGQPDRGSPPPGAAHRPESHALPRPGLRGRHAGARHADAPVTGRPIGPGNPAAGRRLGLQSAAESPGPAQAREGVRQPVGRPGRCPGPDLQAGHQHPAAVGLAGDHRRHGRAGMRVSAHDPKADRAEVAAQTDFRFVEDVYGAVEGADVLVLITAWPEYKSLDFARVRRLMSGSLVIDTANMLDAQLLQGFGFQYFDIGRGRGFDGGSPASSGPHGRV